MLSRGTSVVGDDEGPVSSILTTNVFDNYANGIKDCTDDTFSVNFNKKTLLLGVIQMIFDTLGWGWNGW